MWCGASLMMRPARRRSRDRRKRKMEMEYADGNHRGRVGNWRACVRRIPAGEFEGERTNGRGETERVCGISGNKRGNKGGAVADCYGAVRRGRLADTEHCCKFDEGKIRRLARG